MSAKKDAVKETTHAAEVELTVPERFKVLDFVPTKSDMLTMLIASELQELFTFTESELTSIDFTVRQGSDGKSTYSWSPDKAKELTRVFKLSEGQLKVLKDRIKQLANEKEITLENVKIAKKIENLAGKE